MRRCGKCKEWKDENEFTEGRYLCKLCKKQYNKEYRKKYKEIIKELEGNWYQKNKERILKNRKEYYQNNKEKIRKHTGEYGKLHKKERNEHRKKKRKTNLKYKLNADISAAINRSLKGNKNGYHWELLVNYMLRDLMKRLKKTLPIEMTWQDYLDGKLHIDHITPISAFNFDNVEHIDFKRCWALENLQLLKKIENLRKGSRVDKPFQPSLKMGVK